MEVLFALSSIRTRTTLLTVCAIVAAMTIATLLGVFAIRNIGNSDSDQKLLLLCETGEKDLNYYFNSVEKYVSTVSSYAESDLKETASGQMSQHLERVKDFFSKIIYQSTDVLTYYYRIDPSVSSTDQGFWYVNLDGNGFQEHEVTDITGYDTENTSELVWFTVPKATGKAIWLPPYITDNLGVRVISYNIPIFRNDRFIGVIGIEIDYSTMAREVDHITLYHDGYAFINDENGSIIYHPRMDVTTMKTQPAVPDGLISKDTHLRYSFQGVEKQAVWLPLNNGMRLNVTVPVSEINAGWEKWVLQISVVSLVLLAVFILITMRFTGRITKPLRELTEVAQQVNDGNFDCQLDYQGSDEVGVLTKAFNSLTSHLKVQINDLNNLAYADALTSVRNKGAFDIYMSHLEEELKHSEQPLEFAVCFFDCNNLKTVNDVSGHDKGDLYLKAACKLICEIFHHSPVFRIGGDEFAVVLRDYDFINREQLLKSFDEVCEEKRSQSELMWEQVDIARGIAVYDPEEDPSVDNVSRRADKLMYENKFMSKQQRRISLERQDNVKGTSEKTNNPDGMKELSE